MFARSVVCWDTCQLARPPWELAPRAAHRASLWLLCFAAWSGNRGRSASRALHPAMPGSAAVPLCGNVTSVVARPEPLNICPPPYSFWIFDLYWVPSRSLNGSTAVAIAIVIAICLLLKQAVKQERAKLVRRPRLPRPMWYNIARGRARDFPCELAEKWHARSGRPRSPSCALPCRC